VAERKKDFIISFLKDHLVRGAYRFGQKISAKEISEQTGASRFMVVSALNELQAAGFLKITAQVGCEVVSPSVQEIGDFFGVFGRVEGVLAELATDRHQRSEIGAMKRINEQIRKIVVSDPDAGELYRTLNHEFHTAIHAAARSERLAERQATDWAMADFFVTQAPDFPTHTIDSATEHDAVIAAIERSDRDMARALMEFHLRRLGSDVVKGLTKSTERPAAKRLATADRPS